MATADQIASLRLLIAEDTETRYTEVQLDDRIDAAGGNLTRVAYEIWTEKAAYYTALVDKSEGGSSRSDGQLQDKALKMVDMFKRRLDDESAVVGVTAGRTVIAKLRR